MWKHFLNNKKVKQIYVKNIDFPIKLLKNFKFEACVNS